MPTFLLKNLMLEGEPSWERMIGLKFLISMFFLLIPTILFGASFTSGVKAIRKAMDSSSEAVGEAAMFNTIGAALGAFFGGFILLPNTGMKWGLIICSFIILFLGGIILWKHITKVKFRYITSIFVLSILIVTCIQTPQWDRKILSSGPYFAPWLYVKNKKVILDEKLQTERLLYYLSLIHI